MVVKTLGRLLFLFLISVVYTGIGPDLAEAGCGCQHDCCPPPPPPEAPGPPTHVDATLDDFYDRVVVQFNPPTFGGPYDYYRLYRTTNPNSVGCDGSPFDAYVELNPLFYEDWSAVPGVSYRYSMDSVGPGGVSICSNVEWGRAMQVNPPFPPRNVSATTGDFEDRVIVTWNPPSGGGQAYYFNLYRTDNPNLTGCSSGALFWQQIPTNQFSFIDSSAALHAGQIFYYSLESFGPGGYSVCSNIAGGYTASMAPHPPLFVSASDGHPNDRVRVTWVPPYTGGPVSSYRLYRSVGFTSCNDGYFISSIPGTFTFYDDYGASPGTVHYYSMQSIAPDGQRSTCSNVDGGFINFGQTYRIQGRVSLAVAGNPPVHGAVVSNGVNSTYTDGFGNYLMSNVPGGTYIFTAAKTGYIISPSGFANPVHINGNRTLHFLAVCAPGYILAQNECVSSSGLPGIPTNLQASDGTNNECVDVSWNPAERAHHYILFRSQYGGSMGEPINGPIFANTYCDTSAIPGVHYFYTVKAVNNLGESPPSNTDEGYRGSPVEIIDCDGDGVTDEQETIDGTGVCDPGSFQLHLKSPAFTKYNTFLSQLNYLELTASGPLPVRTRILVYDIDGRVVSQRYITIEAGDQEDIDIGSMAGRIDTYGVVRIDFDDTIVGATLRGRLSNYRYNPDHQTFSFAFARELRNPTRGVTYGTANSIDPQAQSFLVPNWVEIVNVTPVTQFFTVNLFRQDGVKVLTRRVAVPALGSRDTHAGHEFGQGVYLAEIRPDNGASEYLGSIARYSSNHKSGGEAETYNYAFVLEARAGTADRQYAPISNLTGQCWSQLNWVELVNTRERPVIADVTFRGPTGATVRRTGLRLAPRAQIHFQASALLEKGADGSVVVAGSELGSLTSQSAVYYHDCTNNLLQTGYASQTRLPGRDVQAGSFNTNLGMTNLLKVISTNDFGGQYNLTLQTGQSVIFSQDIAISGANSVQYNLSDYGTFGTSPDQYGSVTFRTSQPGAILAQSLRYLEIDGKADFAMPTVVQ